MNKQSFANLAISLVISGAAIFALVNASSALTPKGLFMNDREPSAETAALLEKVSLQQYTMGEQAGHQVFGEFLVQNSSDQPVRNIEVQCEFFDPTGKFLDQQTWLLAGMLEAGGTMQFSSHEKRFIHSETAAVECAIAKLHPATPPSFVLHRQVSEHSGGHGAQESGHGAAPHGHDAAPAAHGGTH